MIQNGHDKHKSNNVDQKQDDSLAQIAQQHEIQMEQHGFVVHLVLPSEESGWANYHTHGLDISRNHLDFQIVLPIQPETAHAIFWSLTRRIDAGEVFHDNELIDDVIQAYPIKLLKTKEFDREIFRILLPDANGLFADDNECDLLYAQQATAVVE